MLILTEVTGWPVITACSTAVPIALVLILIIVWCLIKTRHSRNGEPRLHCSKYENILERATLVHIIIY